MPLELIYGKVGKLQIDVDIIHIKTRPVYVEVQDVQIVVKPITESEEWEKLSRDISETERLQKLELAINEFVWSKFEELKQAELEKSIDKKSKVSLQDIVLDNIKVILKDIHVRIENPAQKKGLVTPFSIGLTLKQVTIDQIDDQNQPVKFMNRSLKENENKILIKRLELVNLGVYYQIGETKFVNDQKNKTAYV